MRTYLAALAALRRPVLRWEGPDGASLELTGPVLANWAHKAHGLLAESEVGPDLDLGVVDSAGLHWRALSGVLAAWSLGASVRIVAEQEPQSDWAALASEHRAEDPVTRSADEVFVFPVAPFALSVAAPVDTIDYATALRTHPDEAPVGIVETVSFGDASTTESAALARLAEPAPGLSDTPAAEVVVMEAPRSAADWGRVLAGLLHGLVVLRQTD
ncbi:hypothetical protein [Brevibacterium yomogidense]|uniref:TIGR03089 family protein n=1 Tax=Brevibacterium yomogidense TaxID=946573 RepID=A0A1X6XP57_9MICO|nr:hypothetical protein [Brevibacterium yomogidense]SLN01144.1 hypothetical protein FM105_14145 [Brevibacterium yomogidense]